VQRALAIFVDLHPGLEQIVVGHARRQFGHQHVRLTLQDQAHLDATARRVAELAQQAVAGKEVGVGDHHPAFGLAQCVQIHVFDVGVVLIVVTKHQAHLTVVIVESHVCPTLAPTLPPEACAARPTTLQQGEMMDVGDRRPLNLHRVILFRFGAEVGQVIAGKVDPANERDQSVDYYNFAVQTAEPVGAKTQVFGRRIKHLQVHAGVAQCREITGGQLTTAETVEADGGAHAAPGGVDQDLL